MKAGHCPAERKAMRQHRWSKLISLLAVLALVGTACGSSDTETTVAPETVPAATEAPATEAPVTEAPTTEAPATTVAAFDLTAVAASYTSGIPEGWLAVGDITAFKDAMTVGGALAVDVREESEYAEGHIEGAISIPLRTLSDNLDKIPTDRQVFVYCASGYRAALAGSALHMLGYDNVLIFPPSWKGWVAAEEPASLDAVAAETFAVPEIAPELLTAADGFLNGIPEGFLSAGNVEKVKEAIGAGVVLVDVRTPEEYAKGHLPDAINVSLRELADGLDMIPTDNAVIVYCGSGHRAALAVTVLQMLGFDNTKTFTGSYKAWVAAGEAVVTA